MLKEFARDLKFFREQKDISLKTISQKTRLNLSALESLEAGDFTFQPQTYIRAFLKQYSAALDLDVEEVLFDYDLARSGKYKPKFTEEILSAQTEAESANEETEAEEESKREDVEEDDVENLRQEAGVEAQETEESVEESVKESDVFTELPKTDNKVRIERDKPSVKTQTQLSAEKEGSSVKLFSSPVFRNIALIVVGLLIVLGIYSLINIMFIEGKSNEPEVIRQNFDEVVQEQEKRLLGKKTPEEILDSIKKAEEEQKKIAVSDSLVLTVSGVAYGEIYVVLDSVNYKNPKKVIYDEGEVKTFKAKNCFHITTANTESFSAKLNGQPIEFSTKAVRKVKITSEGVQN